MGHTHAATYDICVLLLWVWVFMCSSVHACVCEYVPLPNNPRSPPFLAELQSLNWEARDSNFSSPDLISSMYSAQSRETKNKLNKLSRPKWTTSHPPSLPDVLLTLNEFQSLIFSSCDILFPPRRWTTWLIMLHQEVRAAYLSEKQKKHKPCQNTPESDLESGLLPIFLD